MSRWDTRQKRTDISPYGNMSKCRHTKALLFPDIIQKEMIERTIEVLVSQPYDLVEYREN